MGPQKRGSSGYAIASFTSELLSRSTIDMRTKLGSWRRCAAATINNGSGCDIMGSMGSSKPMEFQRRVLEPIYFTQIT